MAFPLIVVAFLIILVWLGILTFYLRRFLSNYRVFTHGSNRKSLDAVLHTMFTDIHDAKKDIAKLIQHCDTIEKKGLYHIQKIGLLRFNPFKDTGGDQSFILTLVDANDTGVVITALYSRSGTRWYAKKVREGKGVEHDLSEEEKKAVKMATGIDNF